MNRRRNNLLILFVLAFLLRLGAVIALHAWRHPDAIEHKTIATSLVTGRGFAFNDFGYFGPSSFQSPTYPFLLAGMFEIFGVQTPAAYFAILVLNCLIGAAIVPLTWLLARMLRGSEAVAYVAAVLVMIWPTQIYACTTAQAIALIAACVTGAMGLFYYSVRTRRLGPWIAFSIIGVLGALTEPAFLPPMACMGLLVLFWRGLPGSLRMRNAIILLGVTILMLGPWTLRNRRVHGAWVPVKSSFWVNTWKANNDFASGSDRLPLSADLRKKLEAGMMTTDDSETREGVFEGVHAYKALTPAQKARLMGRPEIEREKVFKEITTNWIRNNPQKYVRLCWIRFRKTLWVDWDNPKSYKLIYVASRGAILLGSVVGLLLALRKRWSLLIPAIFYLLTLALYTLTITAARFAIPFEPVMLCLTALVLISITDAFGGATADAQAEQPEHRSVEGATLG
ncbi:MAG TPA: hypothetical protein VFW23_15545 [Tepidisphaeraceae bacterium]|nr:hypothetical protein [Tepidisphaeraceae bacterium]